MIDIFDDRPRFLTDVEVAAGALPGESWEQARMRLEQQHHEANNQSSLSGLDGSGL